MHKTIQIKTDKRNKSGKVNKLLEFIKHRCKEITENATIRAARLQPLVEHLSCVP